MTLSSWKYFIFLPLVLLIYAACPKRARFYVLLLASYCFLWLASGKLLVYVLISTLVAYGCARGIARNKARVTAAGPHAPEETRARRAAAKRTQHAIMLAAVLVELGLLVVLKYGGMLAQTLDAARAALGLPQLFGQATSLAMPLGISFYTLMCIGYVVDVYRGKYAATDNLTLFATFVAFFPHLTEGPFSSFEQLAPQIKAGNLARHERFAYASELILWGLIKKMVIADRLNPLVSAVYDTTSYQGIVIVLGVFLYTVQLYADFSGVIDIARGTSELFGITLKTNFAQPFFSHSINEFWRRWHISLGSWLKEYVFFPVSLSRVTRKLSLWARSHLGSFGARITSTLPALLAVWSACGIWHGASWKYLLYGLYYFALVLVGMLLEPAFARLAAAFKQDRGAAVWRHAAQVRTCILVGVGMMLFRADSLTSFAQLLAATWQGAGIDAITTGELFSHGADALDLAVALVGTAALFAFDLYQVKKGSVRELVVTHGTARRWAFGLALLAVLLVFGAYGAGYTPVASIYAGF
ncbi:MAG: MBOAT family O-acyltransferase [Atopobiaceae bacterium]